MRGIAGILTVRPLTAFESHVARIVRSQHRRNSDFYAVFNITRR